MDRRDFAGMLVGVAALMAAQAEGQSGTTAGTAPAAAGAGPRPLKELTSGVFKPQPGKGMVGGRESHQFLAGMLTAGNIRLEMHESVQQPGAPHEAVGTHKHSEIWLVQRGIATLYLNGTEHTMATSIGSRTKATRNWRISWLR